MRESGGSPFVPDPGKPLVSMDAPDEEEVS
jgi:hypothetical protein